MSDRSKPVYGPFRVKCLLCNQVAESWHEHFPHPADALTGLVYCACGQIGVDSLGFAGKGRIRARSEDCFEVVKD